MQRTERPRGVTVQVLDMTSLIKQATDYRRKTNPNVTSVSIYGGPWAIAEKDGKLYAVCHEGVGYTVDDEDPLVVEFHGSYSTDKPGTTTFDCVPFASASLTPADLREFPVSQEADLADFVRVFGARLESNFFEWFRALA